VVRHLSPKTPDAVASELGGGVAMYEYIYDVLYQYILELEQGYGYDLC
jgi:hypothetical protein